MKMKWKNVFGGIILTVLIVSGCSKKGGDFKYVKIDGSSTVFPISEAVAEEFRKKDANIRVTVGIGGTGGGFKKFCAGETDISDASRPIKPSEVELCQKNNIGYIELPVAYDGLTIVINPKNTWAKHITVQELKKLWQPAAQDKIKTWNQVRAGWPNRPIHLYGPGVDSGTYDYFTEAIVGKEHASRGDFTASEDDNVLVQGVSTDEEALGFFGLDYYEENKNKLNPLPVDDENNANGRGPVAASMETVMDGTYQPLSRPIFIYVNQKALNRPEVSQYVQYYLENAAVLSREVGYIPLSKKAYALAQKRVEKSITGSLFEGHGSQVGVQIDVVLEKSLQ